MQQTRNFVSFQRTRILWFLLTLVAKSVQYNNTQPKVSKAYDSLIDLTQDAVKAIEHDRQDEFVERLDRLLDDAGNDMPPWLNK
jgi:hypothetical protein